MSFYLGKVSAPLAEDLRSQYPDLIFGSLSGDGTRRLFTVAGGQRQQELRQAIGAAGGAPSPFGQQSPALGLGDWIKRALTAIGITEARVSSWLGAPCNCSERAEKLNKLGAWASRFWAKQEDGLPLDEPPPI